MKSLPEFPTELDIYLNSLLDLLRTKYYNVIVNRGSERFYFFYSTKEISTSITSNIYLVPRKFTIPTTELLEHFESKQTPPQIKELLK
jgi:hypothetical protein